MNLHPNVSRTLNHEQAAPGGGGGVVAMTCAFIGVFSFHILLPNFKLFLTILLVEDKRRLKGPALWRSIHNN